MKKNINVWLEQAERDLKSAKNSFESKDYYVSALLSQQSAEKSLKFLYLLRKKELIRIHDLVKLAKEVGAPLEIIKICASINPVYVEVRYPEGDELPADKINKKEAEEILHFTGDILKWVKKQF
ncbi:MAG: HEPN domain-containing protein [Nanoarchaeota archaeon]|nr:HEPN domain-containing protein [Nanoarchaeota archaeon]MBU1631921.1 HEPN domain-containing protein [Nanoarchaeota archaeon]MBU1875943.1 HEPN domain-containing protein [Nanoarchaeota archaeon]